MLLNKGKSTVLNFWFEFRNSELKKRVQTGNTGFKYGTHASGNVIMIQRLIT